MSEGNEVPLSPQPLVNEGATCWLNALVQCLKAVNSWPLDTSVLPPDLFGNTPSDSQEALVFLIDKLNLKRFVGEETQTVVYPGGRSVTKNECTLWFHHRERSEVLSGYTDAEGKTHRVAVVQRELTRVPEILVSDVARLELSGKKLRGIVCWGWGHYIAYVRYGDQWWLTNDDHIRPVDAPTLERATTAFYV